MKIKNILFMNFIYLFNFFAEFYVILAHFFKQFLYVCVNFRLCYGTQTLYK